MSDFTPKPDTLKNATKAREAYAKKEVFNYEKVHAAIQEAVTNGQFYLRLTQEHPLDLKGTDAAANLIVKLQEAGYPKPSWEPMRIREKSGGIETGFFIEYPELCIEWGPVKRVAGPVVEQAE